MRLEQTTTLLTGATGGLGGAIAVALAEKGSRVVVSGRRAAELDELAARIGGRAVAADLSTPAGVAALVEAVGPVGVLVANAALPASGPLLEYEAGQIERAVTVNLLAPILLARALAPAMVERGRGQVVLVSSLAGLTSTESSSLYNATKFGLRGFGLGFRQDLHGTGVGVTVVMPGFVREAGMFADSGASLPRGVGTSTPAEVADAVIRAVEEDPAEALVAPLPMRLGARLGGLAPETAARLARVMGSAATAAAVAEGQRRHR